LRANVCISEKTVELALKNGRMKDLLRSMAMGGIPFMLRLSPKKENSLNHKAEMKGVVDYHGDK